FRYREAPMKEGGLSIFISQSGETADTLASLRYCGKQGQHILAVVNVPESSIARESETVFPTLAGPEIGVASTKAFTCQLATLAALAIGFAKARGAISDAQEQEYVRTLIELPRLMTQGLKVEKAIEGLAKDLSKARDVLYLGRGTNYPLALEGALKLKEISYIHAEAYPAGELKHGPLALVDADMPVIAVAPNNHLLDKLKSNMEEVRARGGKLYVFADEAICHGMGEGQVLPIPEAGTLAAPIIATVPLQLLAYHVAVMRGTDVDQPRNLAKSVTVE
ncbi:MAG: isomerizing glutamine--fructose-6-phosphate transaminase, partial [Xanthomonadales bacterium]|nr:isomerizing glutamine--fructose-6-phosphate transaminase [Xanthomonadales bacterium]